MTIQTATPKKPSMEPWKLQMLQLTIIYRILECGDKLPMNLLRTDYEFVESVIQDMSDSGLLVPSEDSQHWECTDKAKELRKAMVQMYDHTTQFEIFGTVHIAKDVGEIDEDTFDPRFEEVPDQSDESKNDLGTEDMRIAMITYISAYAASEDDTVKEINPYIIVFMQMLADAKLQGNIWFDLKCGIFFGTVQEIVESAYDWKNVSNTEDGCREVMGTIYTAGMLEMQKRDADDDEDDDDNDGEEEITTTTTTTEEVWGSDMVYYGHTPYDYYNPYNPLADAIVFCGTVALFDTMCYDYTYGGVYSYY